MNQQNFPLNNSGTTRAAAAIFLAAFFASALLADQIVMKNGDRITGAIVKKDGANLTVKTELFGVVTMAWDKVDSVKSDAPLTVATSDGKTVKGSVALANGSVVVAAPGGSVTVPPANVAAIRDAAEETAFERLEHPGWGQLWAGSATVGFAGSQGNAETLTFTTGLNAARVTKTDKLSVSFNTIDASALVSGKDSQTAQAVRGGIYYDHNIGGRMFLTVFNNYEYDKFQNLNLRFVAGGGFGYHAWKTPVSTFDVTAGADYIHSAYSTPATVQAAEINAGDTFTRKLGKTGATLVQSAAFFDSLNDTSAFRLNFDTGTSVKLTKWLNWNISFSDRYVNQPAAGRKTNDILYTTGFGFTFAR